jgi:hypothetical protein
MRNVIQKFYINFDEGDYLEKAVIWGSVKMDLNRATVLSFNSIMNIIMRKNAYGSGSLRIIKMELQLKP